MSQAVQQGSKNSAAPTTCRFADNRVEGIVSFSNGRIESLDVQHNWITSWRNWGLTLSPLIARARVSENVIHAWNGVIYLKESQRAVPLVPSHHEISNNHFEIEGQAVIINETSETDPITLPTRLRVTNNLIHSQIQGGIFCSEKRFAEVSKKVDIDHNGYGAPPNRNPRKNWVTFGLQNGDFANSSQVLSDDLDDHQSYLRIAKTSSLATRGASGKLPKHIGAFPPGPALHAGDWFTKLLDSDREERREPGYLRRLSGHTGQVNRVVLSPDGKTAFSGGNQKMIYAWDVDTGLQTRTFAGHTGGVWGLAISPDGRFLLSGEGQTWTFTDKKWVDGKDFSLRLWDVQTGEVVRRFVGHNDTVYDTAFSRDGKYAVSCSLDSTVRLWVVATGQQLRRYDGHQGRVTDVAFLPDGKRVLSVGHDKTLRIWDVSTETELRKFTLSSEIEGFDVSQDGKRVLLSLWDDTVRLWELSSGKILTTLRHPISCRTPKFAGQGQFAVVAAWDGVVRVWDLNSQLLIHQFVGHTRGVMDIAVSPERRLVLSASTYQEVRIWRLPKTGTFTAGEVRRFDVQKDQKELVSTVAISQDGRFALSAAHDKSVRLWNLATGEEVRQFKGHTEWATGVALSRDGKYALSGGGGSKKDGVSTAGIDNDIRLWNVENGNEIRKFKGHTDLVHRVTFSKDGKRALSCSKDTTIRLWDVETGKTLNTLKDSGWVTSVVFSPDEKQVLTTAPGNTIRLWDLATGEDLKQFKGQEGPQNALFLADGRQIVSCGKDGTVRLWSIESGKELRQFLGHSGPVLGLALSADGTLLATGGGDQTVRIWNVKTGQVVHVFEGHTGLVIDVKFLPDGRHVLSCGPDGSIRLWRLPKP